MPAPRKMARRPTTRRPRRNRKNPFFLTIGGGIALIVILVFVIVGINVFKKIKGRANDVLE